ncbi:MAG: CBS domain-containing protein [Candidatus Riflebacteria bacterium]|nr:CBS domain-containing protein [Candidatus Riflebacteria bacterium]
MVPNPLFLKPEQSVFTARELMIVNGYECLYVVDKDGKPTGVVTTLTAAVEDSKKKVSKVATTDFQLISQDWSIQEAAGVFAKNAVKHLALPVVDAAGVMVGIVRVKDLVADLSTPVAPSTAYTPETLVVQLAMSKDMDSERNWMAKIKEMGYLPAVTQVGTSAEKLPLKLRESSIVAAIAHGVIKEDSKDKIAVSYAVRDIVAQMDVVSPGLGGGYKVGIVRGEGRVSVAVCGRSGHALASSNEQIFLGVSVI